MRPLPTKFKDRARAQPRVLQLLKMQAEYELKADGKWELPEPDPRKRGPHPLPQLQGVYWHPIRSKWIVWHDVATPDLADAHACIDRPNCCITLENLRLVLPANRTEFVSMRDVLVPAVAEVITLDGDSQRTYLPDVPVKAAYLDLVDFARLEQTRPSPTRAGATASYLVPMIGIDDAVPVENVGVAPGMAPSAEHKDENFHPAIEMWPHPSFVDWGRYGVAVRGALLDRLQYRWKLFVERECAARLVVPHADGEEAHWSFSRIQRIATTRRPRAIAIVGADGFDGAVGGAFLLAAPRTTASSPNAPSSPPMATSQGARVIAFDLGTSNSCFAQSIPGQGPNLQQTNFDVVDLATSRTLFRLWRSRPIREHGWMSTSAGGEQKILATDLWLKLRQAQRAERSAEELLALEPFRDFGLVSTERDPLEDFVVTRLKWADAEKDRALLTLFAALTMSTAVASIEAANGPNPNYDFKTTVPLAFTQRQFSTYTAALAAAAKRASDWTHRKITTSRAVDESRAGIYAAGGMGLFQGDAGVWALTVDIGGGSTDYALYRLNTGADGKPALSPMAVDSVHFGADLVLERFSRVLQMAFVELRMSIRKGGFDEVRAKYTAGAASDTKAYTRAAASAYWLRDLVIEYAARLVVGAALNRRLQGKVGLVVVPLGNGWRTLEANAADALSRPGTAGALCDQLRERAVALSDGSLELNVSFNTSLMQQGLMKTGIAVGALKADLDKVAIDGINAVNGVGEIRDENAGKGSHRVPWTAPVGEAVESDGDDKLKALRAKASFGEFGALVPEPAMPHVRDDDGNRFSLGLDNNDASFISARISELAGELGRDTSGGRRARSLLSVIYGSVFAQKFMSD